MRRWVAVVVCVVGLCACGNVSGESHMFDPHNIVTTTVP